MALDPSIALGIKPAEPFDITKFQQLRNLAMQEQAIQQQIAASQASEALTRQQIPQVAAQTEVTRAQLPQIQAQTELTRAQVPGVEAESAIRARAAAFNKWVSENAKDHIDPVTGQVDRQKLSYAATKAGYPAEGDAIFASYAANLATMSNVGKVASDVTNQSINHIANGLQFIKDPATRASYLKTSSDYMERLFPGSGAQIMNTLGNVDPKTRMIVPDMTKVDAVNKSSMTPLEAGNLAVAQQSVATSAEAVRQSGLANITGPEARDPNSRMSQAARNFAIAAGVPGVMPTMNAAEINNLAGFKEAVREAVVPSGAKTQAAGAATGGRTAAVKYNAAADIVDRLKQQGKLTGSTNISTWIQANKEKLLTDPDFRTLQAELSQITANNPSINTNIGADALSSQLRTSAKTAEKEVGEAERIVRATTFSQLPEGPAAQKTPPAAKGQQISKAQVEAYAKSTNKTVNQILQDFAKAQNKPLKDVITEYQQKGYITR